MTNRTVWVSEDFVIGRRLPDLSVIERCRQIAKDLGLTPQNVYDVYVALEGK